MKQCVIYDSCENDEWSEDDSLRLEWGVPTPGRWSEAYCSFCSSVWSYQDGPLSDRAYRVLLAHFGLEDAVVWFPKSKIQAMGPDQLMRIRPQGRRETGENE